MKLTIPELSLVVLIGASGAGKSTFARARFKPTEVLSSDFCRGLVSDDENCQAVTNDAFDLLHFILHKRLIAGRLTVIDATNVEPASRKELLEIAREHDCLAVAIVFSLPERVCHDRNRSRPDRSFGPHVVRRQTELMRRSLRGLQREGFRYIYTLGSEADVEAATVERQPLWNDRRQERGPFDVIGDVHGCCQELLDLLGKLGYTVAAAETGSPVVTPPDGRKAIFLGDLVDRGPDSPGVLRLVMPMVAAGAALCVPGNHDVKLLRKLKGRDVQVRHGLAETLEQLERETPEFREQVAAFLDGLVSHYVMDDGRLVVAHAGMKAEYQGRGSSRVRDFALYGETTGETDEFGLPVRWNWAAEYRGPAIVVYGHTPVPEAEWLNHTINIDTGCVFGGKLTALRYPERELVSVPARQVYAASVKPFLPEPPAELTAQQAHDDLLNLDDVMGKRRVETRLHGAITIREENATAALEIMSRFAADPRWLIYLPPTMSPCETSHRSGLLEHPAEAFAYYRQQGLPRVICQEKHMGSRVVLIACKDAEAARRRFGVRDGEAGSCVTRTGRRFFEDRSQETAVLQRVRRAMDASGLWEELATDWVCLDAELMPWSAKAQELLRGQYAAVGAAAGTSLPQAVAALEATALRCDDAAPLLARTRARFAMAEQFVAAYGRYCWPVHSPADLRLAPFHLLATEDSVHVNRDHLWHMTMLHRLCGSQPSESALVSRAQITDSAHALSHPPAMNAPDTGEADRGRERGDPDAGGTRLQTATVRAPQLVVTPCRTVDVTDPADEEAAVAWWEELTARGGEGMVVKPLDFVARGPRGLVQPAVKCRGVEYLRIIYGPEYTVPENLERLRARGLGAKRSLALREFALGVEALERFVRHEPLRRVHECVFGVLALESEPVDPRL